MESNVRDLVRYVIIKHQGGLVDDLVIFVEGSSHVTVYTVDGEVFTGDLLSLEALAKLHGGVAYPVERPKDFSNEVDPVEVLPPGVSHEEEPISSNWADQVEGDNSTGGVTLPGAIDPGPTPSSVKPGDSPQDVTVPMGNSHLETCKGVEVQPIVGSGHPPLVTIDPDISLWKQGVPGGVGPWNSKSNPYDENPGNGIGSIVIHLDSLDRPPDWYGKVPVRFDLPVQPLSLGRDLGNCLRGMPRSAGTTIAGRVRPDTGNCDPVLPDHKMWEEYEWQLACDDAGG